MSVIIEVRGNLGQSFDLRAVNTVRNEASMVLNFSVASQNFKRKADGSGFETVGDPEWIECEYWNRGAAHLRVLLRKGMPVFLRGEERIETYTNKDGVEVRVRKLRVNDLFIIPSERIEQVVMREKRTPAPEATQNQTAPTAPQSFTAKEYAAASQGSSTPRPAPQAAPLHQSPAPEPHSPDPIIEPEMSEQGFYHSMPPQPSGTEDDLPF